MGREATSEIATKAAFHAIRYAQCWEDGDVLLKALAPQPHHTVVSIASAGDNTFSLLSQGPARVLAVDLSPAQLACVALRKAAYQALSHVELLTLLGTFKSRKPLGEARERFYQRCRPLLPPQDQLFWDHHRPLIRLGIGHAGKFERYFQVFRERVLPWVHGPMTVAELVAPKSAPERRAFYRSRWNTWRWQALFRVFFSRRVMGWLGRDPRFFDHVAGSVSDRILSRTEDALTVLDPSENPYLHWILFGEYRDVLPHALRIEQFEAIREHLDKLESRQMVLEALVADTPELKVDRWNLSDIFEYMSPTTYASVLDTLVAHSQPGARLAYWNMLAPRQRPEAMADRLAPLTALARECFSLDKAFFYSAFVVEEVQAPPTPTLER
jgi:S-adenosylmethionine-diacylglycerol 3-amino-3-carboxypropyl transferase